MIEKIFELSGRFLRSQNRSFTRYLLTENPFSSRCSLLVGQRGVGKTTLLIQYLLKLSHNNPATTEGLYVPCDHFAVADLALYDIAEQFVAYGGKVLCLDEIHRRETAGTNL